MIALFYQSATALRELSLSHNELRERGGLNIGEAIGRLCVDVGETGVGWDTFSQISPKIYTIEISNWHDKEGESFLYKYYY